MPVRLKMKDVLRPLVQDGMTATEIRIDVFNTYGILIDIDQLEVAREHILEELYPSQHPDLDIFTKERMLALPAPDVLVGQETS